MVLVRAGKSSHFKECGVEKTVCMLVEVVQCLPVSVNHHHQCMQWARQQQHTQGEREKLDALSTGAACHPTKRQNTSFGGWQVG